MLGLHTRRMKAKGNRVCRISGEFAGEPFALIARHGVIPATGGFEWDAELRQTFLRAPADTLLPRRPHGARD